MLPPNLSQPTLYNRTDFLSHPTLVSGLISLANSAFSRSKAEDTTQWIDKRPRFASLDLFFEMLSEGSFVALIFDLDVDAEQDSTENGHVHLNDERNFQIEGKKIVACAAAVPWKGGWAKEGAGKESGWEMKAVCVDGNDKYLRRGLAVQLLNALEAHLIEKGRAEFQSGGAREKKGELRLWILAAECTNGAYWRKRGYREIRRKTEGPGVWSCKTSFEMVVFRRDVSFDVEGKIFRKVEEAEKKQDIADTFMDKRIEIP